MDFEANENKKMLWDLLCENKYFENLPINIIKNIQTIFENKLNEINDCWIGVSMLPSETGILVRATCGSAGVIVDVAETIWNAFRQWRLGSNPEARRRGL